MWNLFSWLLFPFTLGLALLFYAGAFILALIGLRQPNPWTWPNLIVGIVFWVGLVTLIIWLTKHLTIGVGWS